MGRPRKPTIEAQPEYVEMVEQIIGDYPQMKKWCDEYEKKNADILKLVGASDIYPVDAPEMTELYLTNSLPGRDGVELDTYLENRRKMHFLEHGIFLQEGATKKVAELLFLRGYKWDAIQNGVEGFCLSRRTIAKEKKRAVAFVANYIYELGLWEAEQLLG